MIISRVGVRKQKEARYHSSCSEENSAYLSGWIKLLSYNILNCHRKISLTCDILVPVEFPFEFMGHNETYGED